MRCPPARLLPAATGPFTRAMGGLCPSLGYLIGTQPSIARPSTSKPCLAHLAPCTASRWRMALDNLPFRLRALVWRGVLCSPEAISTFAGLYRWQARTAQIRQRACWGFYAPRRMRNWPKSPAPRSAGRIKCCGFATIPGEVDSPKHVSERKLRFHGFHPRKSNKTDIAPVGRPSRQRTYPHDRRYRASQGANPFQSSHPSWHKRVASTGKHEFRGGFS